MSKTVTCPDCQNKIELPEDTEIGDVIVCDSCGVELEVINLDPPKVDYLLAQK